MKEYTSKIFNAKHLLKYADFDIRDVAKQNRSLYADDYFAQVEQFIEDCPAFLETLSGITKLNEDLKALKELESKLGVEERSVDIKKDSTMLADIANIQKALSEIGCHSLNEDFEFLSQAVKSGNLKLSENLASQIHGTLSAILERTKSALLKIGPTHIKSHSEHFLRTVTLQEALDYFDYVEEHRKLRVLAVDDVSVVLSTITSILSPYYEVYAIKSSSQVEKFLTMATPELFLLDIEMSELNGFDLIPIIRSFKEHEETPIIFLTGNASLNNLKDAVALGVCDFITKPICADVLLEKIESKIVRKKMF